ncbi:MAG: radical SAM family heme chaperone HemW [Victivallales bacterium]|nr:radical SAM family heme chaperone HemW [Victivallales bacterium]
MTPYRSLYVHVPFCRGGKCAYCAFYSEGHSTPEMRSSYLAHIQEEFRRNGHLCAPLRSIFIGGGTPGALEEQELKTLLSSIRENFILEPDCEWSMEANPDSITESCIAIAAEAGVNRISFGVQSFNGELRRRIGRHASPERLESLADACRTSGIKRMNLDLIYGIPGEKPEEWEADMRQALALHPAHLSCYSLILEPGTPLAEKYALTLEDEENFLTCWHLCDSVLGEAGMRRYEISNFAAPGRECRHNYEIWHGQTYLGCGPSAVSFDGTDRPANPASLTEWLAGKPREHDILPPEERRREIFAFAMRTADGWTWDELEQMTGIRRSEAEAIAAQVIAQGLAVSDEYGLHPTPGGLLCNDDLLAALL